MEVMFIYIHTRIYIQGVFHLSDLKNEQNLVPINSKFFGGKIKSNYLDILLHFNVTSITFNY